MANVFRDVSVTNGDTYHYQVRIALGTNEQTASSVIPATPAAFADDAAFLEALQAFAFDYFWWEANPANGLVRDRSTPRSFCSIAAVGFGMTALGIGIDHGWITREQGKARALVTLTTFLNGRQGAEPRGVCGHRGWYYHFLDPRDGTRFEKVELSSIDTALLLAGVLYLHEYFDGQDATEARIREMAEALYDRVDWAWMANGDSSFTMGWHPESGFLASRWIGYNEAMVLYVLALGAGHNPVSGDFWRRWTSGYRWGTEYGQSFVVFPPLFGHQYSHCWIDFRGLADDYLRPRGIDYFENSRRATLAQQAYCMANPRSHAGYSRLVWGLTACDGPGRDGVEGYSARGAPPGENDDGTLAPTAVGGSLPFAPEICLPTLRHFHETWRNRIWTPYGFCDAMNLRLGWWDSDVLGIDQGPILLMIENYRTGRVWKTFMKSAVIQRGLMRAGFRPLAPAGS